MKHKIFLSTVIFLSFFILCSCCAPEKNNDDILEMNADSFEVLPNGTLVAKGNVEITTKLLTIETPKMIWYKTNQTALLDAPVRIIFTNQTSEVKSKK